MMGAHTLHVLTYHKVITPHRNLVQNMYNVFFLLGHSAVPFNEPLKAWGLLEEVEARIDVHTCNGSPP